MSQLTSNEINIVSITLGRLVIVLGLFSHFFKERLRLSGLLVTLLLGVLLSPSVFGLIDLSHWGKPETILEQAHA